MKLKKPKFWDYKKPSTLAYLLLPISYLFKLIRLFKLESKIKKTAGFSFEQMDWHFIDESELNSFLADGFSLVALETCDMSTNIFKTSLPKRCILLAGNESHGLPEAILERSKIKVYVPMPGACKSMNVSHAISVAAFEWFRQNNLSHG